MRNTHRPWPKATDPQPDYVLPPYPVADTPETRRDYCDYLESLSHADACLGEVMESLKENGLWDDTALLFTTDHGLAMPGAKCNMYDSGIGVAFILRRPGQKHAVCNALCSQIDLFPTVCDLLGVRKPDWLEGRSMLPLLDGSADEINEFVYSEVTFHATYEPLSHMPKPREMFFDLTADPGERVNLLEGGRLENSGTYRAEYARHAAALEGWMRRTNDPMLRGENMYTLGKGKITNPTDGLAPDHETAYVIGEEGDEKDRKAAYPQP